MVLSLILVRSQKRNRRCNRKCDMLSLNNYEFQKVRISEKSRAINTITEEGMQLTHPSALYIPELSVQRLQRGRIRSGACVRACVRAYYPCCLHAKGARKSLQRDRISKRDVLAGHMTCEADTSRETFLNTRGIETIAGKGETK
ncbi:uncharacterized protein LOC143426789 [Xylocopa sonorina]|uniref:uncharacterized protein LOC143426789 n=1 Tax=Xylocopa sonorina TaxID=1818115 RepID=UPI00403AA468